MMYGPRDELECDSTTLSETNEGPSGPSFVVHDYVPRYVGKELLARCTCQWIATFWCRVGPPYNEEQLAHDEWLAHLLRKGVNVDGFLSRP